MSNPFPTYAQSHPQSLPTGGYSGSSFPAAKKAPKAKKACAYGPRMANGRCPPKPRSSSSSSVSAYLTKPGRRAPSKATRITNIAGKAIGTALATGVGAVFKGARAAGGLRAALSGVQLGSASTITAAGAAGLAAYWLTSKLIAARVKGKQTLSQEAAYAADAYRQSRLDLQKTLGRPITALENSLLAKAFRDRLAEIGLSTTDMKRLKGSYFSNPNWIP